MPQIAELYSKWKKQNVEVIFIALDQNEQDYPKFICH
jgi:hypothetical protein